MSTELIALFLASPVVLAIVNALTNKVGKGVSEKLTEIENKINEVSDTFSKYKIEQAIQDFRHKNWLLIETGTVRRYSNKQWYMLKSNLERLLPQEEWSEELKEEAKAAEKILRGEKE